VAQIGEPVWQLRGEVGEQQDEVPPIGLAQIFGGAFLEKGGVSAATILSTR